MSDDLRRIVKAIKASAKIETSKAEDLLDKLLAKDRVIACPKKKWQTGFVTVPSAEVLSAVLAPQVTSMESLPARFSRICQKRLEQQLINGQHSI